MNEIIVFEQDWEEIDLDKEDGGMALIYTMSNAYDDAFVRFQSWDREKKHLTFNKFAGKRIRITVETI